MPCASGGSKFCIPGLILICNGFQVRKDLPRLRFLWHKAGHQDMAMPVSSIGTAALAHAHLVCTYNSTATSQNRTAGPRTDVLSSTSTACLSRNLPQVACVPDSIAHDHSSG